jgi:nucleoside-diphosphate-sugar epimerase
MKRVLIIGGTRYLGLELLNLFNEDEYELFIASRKDIGHKNFVLIDRKNQKDLDDLFKKTQYDLVIDFICYSAIDATILWNSIQLQKKKPKLILISTVYTYGNPLEIESDLFCNEKSFQATYYLNSFKDRPLVSYSNGKKDMECFFNKRVQKEKLTILRFPIILGAEDYTFRTHFYYNLIKEGLSINPRKIKSKSSYIFIKEAANSIFNFVKHDDYGTYNVAFESISEEDLIGLYCSYFNKTIDNIVDESLVCVNTPFTSNFDFNIVSEKYLSKYPFGIRFKDCLFRELLKIDK